MTPAFISLESRLGMHRPPWKRSSLNVGVENGSQAVLSPTLLSHYPRSTHSHYRYTLPEQLNGQDVFEAMIEHSRNASALIQKQLHANRLPIIVGGDHSVSLASFHAIFSVIDPKKVGIIRIDSHPDLLLRHQSTTGNIHGMWMRPFLDMFDQETVAAFARPKLHGSQIIYIGNMDSEPGEINGMQHHKILQYDRNKLQDSEVESQIQTMIKQYNHIIVDIDIDAFDQSIAPATGIPAEHGLLLEDIDFLPNLVRSKLCCLNIVEVNPQLDVEHKTVALAQTLIRHFIK